MGCRTQPAIAHIAKEALSSKKKNGTSLYSKENLLARQFVFGCSDFFFSYTTLQPKKNTCTNDFFSTRVKFFTKGLPLVWLEYVPKP